MEETVIAAQAEDLLIYFPGSSAMARTDRDQLASALVPLARWQPQLVNIGQFVQAIGLGASIPGGAMQQRRILEALINVKGGLLLAAFDPCNGDPSAIAINSVHQAVGLRDPRSRVFALGSILRGFSEICRVMKPAELTMEQWMADVQKVADASKVSTEEELNDGR